MKNHACLLRLSPRVTVALAVLLAACGSAVTTVETYSCTPACPTGATCTSAGCVTDPPFDLAVGGATDLTNPCAACVGSTPRCTPQGVCVACLVDGDCPDGQVCHAAGATNVCVTGCQDDARCGKGPGGETLACCGGACIDPATDPGNCGGCGTTCSPAHAAASCAAGACQPGECDPLWGDCNGDPADGCETNLHIDAKNCGACKAACTIKNGLAGCSDGNCYVGACTFGWDDCNGDPKDGCEVSVVSDKNNCGACGNACTNPPHARAGCLNAACQLSACDQGFADCNGDPKDGCEVAVAGDVKNCGACGNTCPQGLVCKSGGCTCPQCNFPNARSKCLNNVCVIDACVPDWGDCNGDPKDGCELDLTADPKNCGACKVECDVNAPFCYQSACSQFSLFPNQSYAADITFTDVLGGTTMGLTWDGSSYWSVSGGGPGGDRLASYDANGANAKKYQPGIDFRSVFTKNGKDPQVYARGFNSQVVQSMGNPGAFAASVTLQGANVDSQSAVVFDDTGKELIAMIGGAVTRFDSGTGKFIASLQLQGFGNMNGENVYPQNRGIAKAHGYYLTYSSGVLSAWDEMGVRQKTTILTKGGTAFDSYFGMSYAHGRVFVVDQAGGTWRGYDVGL